MRIGWPEVAVDLSGQSSDVLLEDWRWLVPATYVFRMVSSLGDAFLESPSGEIHWLDVGGAELICIARNRQHFDQLRKEPEYASDWFIPNLVGDLLTSGKVLAAGQCFSYKIPLSLGGLLELRKFEACDLQVHFSVLGQIQRQVAPLPIGTRITSVKIGDVP